MSYRARSVKGLWERYALPGVEGQGPRSEQSAEGQQGVQQLFGMDASGDEDDPGSVVLVGPLTEVLRRVDDVLHAVEDDGSSLPNVEEPLDSQHVLAPGVEQHAEPDPERSPVDGSVERNRDGVGLSRVVQLIVLRS
jgi:hypothetical protein